MSLLGKIAVGSVMGLGAVGAAAGATTSVMAGNGPGEGALVGGALGVAAVPAVVGAGALAWGASGPVGSAMIGGATGIANAAPIAAAVTAQTAAGVINGVGTSGFGSTLASPLRRHVGAIKNLGSSLVKWDMDTSTMMPTREQSLLGKVTKTGGVKLSAAGHSVLWGSALVGGTKAAFSEYNRSKMGQMDGQITRATPRTPSYDLNAGASGDLVFALNSLRKG